MRVLTPATPPVRDCLHQHFRRYLIAYIDAYYGGDGGTIIDHKMWRAGNSDTNPEFAGYLANYQDHRTHD